MIVNPIAGHGRGMALLPMVVSKLNEHQKEHTVHITQSPMDARAIACRVTAGSEGVIGFGGDGTLQEIVTGMWEAGQGQDQITTPLGIVPCGSGNDFVLTLDKKQAKKKNDRQTVEILVNHLINRRIQTVDLLRANDMAFLNIANIGLDARIVYNAIKLKSKFKGNAYMASAFQSILQHENVKMRINVNGEQLDDTFALIAVCNGQYYGGGLRIAPHASIRDGKITVCLVSRLSRPKALILFPSVLFERHVALKAVRFIECERLTITLTGTESFCMDGNLYDRSGVITFSILPGALPLFAGETC